ncbi:protein FAR1-RELATED SEQUENCE 5-like [Tripterygium wilfordii]|uniref:protein FAR1-RELATED SEQUENCE 5-like n=1 Tax=Tripterygium wilfordii TaxID=458696 RepID=UPI0018F83620|nr:protein FAR1-RELATED SEQUENCE 5-like [Tripterygium wilfordii]
MAAISVPLQPCKQGCVMEINAEHDRDNSPLLNENEEIEEPKQGIIFSSKEDIYAYYKRYANQIGFSVALRSQHVGVNGELKYFVIECSRAGKKKSKSELNPLKPSLSAKVDCKARLRAILQKDETFMISKVVLEHNHELISSDIRHFKCNKRINTPTKRRLELNDQAGIGVSRNFTSLVVEAGGYDHLSFDEKDCRNYIEKARRLRLGEGDAESIRNYFLRMQRENSNFFYIIDFDDNCRIKNLFWADSRSRSSYEVFGDVVSFDTTYLTNKYDMSFAPFVGVNHHGQSILLGCGLLSSEDTDTFVWLFKSWLACMFGRPPMQSYAKCY